MIAQVSGITSGINMPIVPQLEPVENAVIADRMNTVRRQAPEGQVVGEDGNQELRRMQCVGDFGQRPGEYQYDHCQQHRAHAGIPGVDGFRDGQYALPDDEQRGHQ